MDNAEEILRGLRAFEPQAWEQFHQQYWPYVLAVLSRKFPDLAHADAARDVTTDTLLAVVHQVRKGTEIQPEALTQYVLQIARRKALHAVVQQRKQQSEADQIRHRLDGRFFAADQSTGDYSGHLSQQPDLRPDPEQQLRLTRKAELMQKALAALRPCDRDLLQRFYYRGETKEQIMAAYAISPDQFRRYKSRALTRLMAHVYGEHSASNSETGTMYTRQQLRERVGPCRH